LAARKLGQYQLKQRLGEGGMGEVYFAEHVLLRRPCAVKVIRPSQAGDPDTLQRFLREVQVTATLTHPNNIQIFDYGQASDGTVFYAMEYLSGLNLDELVRRHGPLPPRRANFVLRQLCGALAEAHAISLIHRDIKPSNVILCQRGGLHDVVKLLDFGLARMQSTETAGRTLTQAELIFGTPAFMSPEQASGKKQLDERSDIYSLGALAYFLVIGQPPFVRDSVVETLNAHINEEAVPLRSSRHDLLEDFESIVLRCLAKRPGERFSTVSDVQQALLTCGQNDWTELEAAAWWNGHLTDVLVANSQNHAAIGV
jgi:serine/threonine-protein kinase